MREDLSVHLQIRNASNRVDLRALGKGKLVVSLLETPAKIDGATYQRNSWDLGVISVCPG